MEPHDNIIYFEEWTELVEHLETTKSSSKIYRGQSNDFNQEPMAKTWQEFLNGARGNIVKPIFWEIISSFDRYYRGRYPFGLFLSQQLEDNNFKYTCSNINASVMIVNYTLQMMNIFIILNQKVSVKPRS